MTAKHTPGPWKLVADTAGFKIQPVADFMPEIGHSRLDIAHVNQYDNGIKIEQCESNAHLIAAAPELLEALKAAEEVLTGSFEDKELTQEHIMVISDIRAAIAKAEGKQA